MTLDFRKEISIQTKTVRNRKAAITCNKEKGIKVKCSGNVEDNLLHQLKSDKTVIRLD